LQKLEAFRDHLIVELYHFTDERNGNPDTSSAISKGTKGRAGLTVKLSFWIPGWFLFNLDFNPISTE